MLNVRSLIPWTRERGMQGTPAEHPLAAFQREFDRLFDDLWRGFEMPMSARFDRALGSVAPRIEMAETDAAITLRAELPGLEEKDVELTLADNVLTVSGEKKTEREEKETGVAYSECAYGAFQRRIPLPADVVEEQVTATFRNGVLTVTLPKSPKSQEKVRRIHIGAEGASVKSSGTLESVG